MMIFLIWLIGFIVSYYDISRRFRESCRINEVEYKYADVIMSFIISLTSWCYLIVFFTIDLLIKIFSKKPPKWL